MTNTETLNEMFAKARTAQEEFAEYDQVQVDAVVKAIARAVFDNAERLARMAVDETGMGVYEDKVRKNIGKSRVIWNDCKGGKSVGVVERIPEEGIVAVAKPMGVIGCITPAVEPVVTPMCNAMFAAKGGNAVIICPHPLSVKCSAETVRMINAELARLGAPENLIQCIADPAKEISKLVMEKCDVCICTGESDMVKAAYSSGKPAFGASPGNVQAIIDTDVKFGRAIPMIIEGRCFDNGIICSSEQTAVIPSGKIEEAIKIFEEHGTYYASRTDEVQAIRRALFHNGELNKALIGKSAAEVAAAAGIQIPEGTRMILVKADFAGDNDDLAKRKMAPVQALYTYDSWDEAISIARANLKAAGAGHSVVIHSCNQEHIENAALKLPASRFLINQICSADNGGSFFNGLHASTTLGCGSLGNNSRSENLSWEYMFNKSRIAYIKPDSSMPSDREIWS
jgi:succinate-semialdehyde dehydrogenase